METQATTDPPKAEETKTQPGAAVPQGTEAPKAVGLAELSAAIPDATADFKVKCLESAYTLDQANAAWMDVLREKNKATNEELEKAQAAASSPGNKPLGTGKASATDDDAGDATDRFNARVTKKVDGGMARHKAFQAVCKEDPELRRGMLHEHNTKHGRPCSV